MNPKPIDVLLIEDNPGDVRLTQEAFKEFKVLNCLHIVNDGVQAMKFLLNEGEFSKAPRPDIILLDLNLPRKSGHEVLVEIKSDGNLKKIPVVILTTSTANRDIDSTYREHANCYITKPVDFEQFTNVVKAIEDFWLTIVKLPSFA